MPSHQLDCTCLICDRRVTLQVNEDDYRRWFGGMLIQRAMPYLTPDERELLVPGICGQCFDSLFDDEGDS